jgi:hypothetical protein
VGLALALVLWLVLKGGEPSNPQRAPASAASIQRLNSFASSLRHPIYWAGAKPGYTYELTKTKDGRVYIRYLPPGVKPGSPQPNYLTIGTYPQRHAFATLHAAAKKQGASTIRLRGGGAAFQDKNRPTSMYLAYPNSPFQVEVFDPSARRSRQLVVSGRITKVGTPPPTRTGPRAASVPELKTLAALLGHPIYWAGDQTAMRYEVTTTKTGSVYVRYLPPGATLGDHRPSYLTIGTYPQPDAFRVLKRTAATNHVDTLRLENGGLAFVDKNHPTSLYLAYPGVDLQIEVYDPDASRARQVVTSGRIRPLG